MKHPCPICGSSAEVNIALVKCVRCGGFSVDNINTFTTAISGWTAEQLANLSGWIRNNSGCELSVNNLRELARLASPSVGAKGEKLLLWLAKIHPTAGKRFSFIVDSFNGDKAIHISGLRPDTAQMLVKPEFLAYSWAQDFQEFGFILENYLEKEMGFVEFGSMGYRITPKGWAYLESLRHGNPESRIGFIAMWFDTSMNEAWKAIDQGIRDAGYEPLRIDQKQHNNKIDDEIIAGIRRSKFLVADFTSHRGGVYFEAGLAMGLGLPVIWLCRHDHLKETHFDTRQYNFIVWEADKLSNLTKALQNRIEATTIGRGPLQSTT